MLLFSNIFEAMLGRHGKARGCNTLKHTTFSTAWSQEQDNLCRRGPMSRMKVVIMDECWGGNFAGDRWLLYWAATREGRSTVLF